MKDDIEIVYKCLLAKNSHIRSHNIIMDSDCGWKEEHVMVTMFDDGREIEISFSVYFLLGLLNINEQNMKLSYYPLKIL